MYPQRKVICSQRSPGTSHAGCMPAGTSDLPDVTILCRSIFISSQLPVASRPWALSSGSSRSSSLTMLVKLRMPDLSTWARALDICCVSTASMSTPCLALMRLQKRRYHCLRSLGSFLVPFCWATTAAQRISSLESSGLCDSAICTVSAAAKSSCASVSTCTGSSEGERAAARGQMQRCDANRGCRAHPNRRPHFWERYLQPFYFLLGLVLRVKYRLDGLVRHARLPKLI